MFRLLFAFAFFALCCLSFGANAGTAPIKVTTGTTTVVNQLDPTTHQPQIQYWNNTDPNTIYIITFVNLFETHNETKIDAVNHTVYQPTDWQIYPDPTNPYLVNFTANWTTTNPPTLNTNHFKNITFVNKISDPAVMKTIMDAPNWKVGKFDIIITDYNFSDTKSSADLALTFELNQTTNGAQNNSMLENDQSLNIQFGWNKAYFAVNNTATNKDPSDTPVSVFRAAAVFNMTQNNTYNVNNYFVDNMHNVYIFYSHFPNGTITHDPEYGIGIGVPAAGKGKTVIIVVSIAAALIVVAAVIAGCYVFLRRGSQSRKNYSRI